MWTESLIAGIERVRSLDAVGKVLSQAVSKVVRPGRTKDLLAGTWLGHPVHPMLTDVPIGAWTSAFVLDLFGGRQARRAADALVGVGVLAAVPTAATGLSDLADVEHSEQRILGTAHALGNVTAVALYGGSFLARRRGRRDLGVRLATLGAAVVTGLADRCSHRGGPLHEGRVHDGQVTCPWHWSTFRLDDGSILQGPATAPQPCYDVRVHDGAVDVRERR
jgi:nitrite reductase/ring-hydroxylating ferredoxin subunit